MFTARLGSARDRLHDLVTHVRSDRRWLALGVGLLALVVFANDSGLSPGVVLAAGLVAVGVMLLRPDETGPVSSDGRADERPAPVRARRPRSKLLLVTVAATFLVMGGAFTLEAMEVWETDVGRFTALPLLVIGIALIVGAWLGRSRLLVLVGMVLIPVVAVSNIGHIPFPARIGDTYSAPQRPFHLQDSYEVMFGSTTLDLTHLRPRGRDITIPVEFGVGEVDVLVPPRFAISVTARLRAGALYVFGRSERGEGLTMGATRFEDARKRGSINIDISGAAGSIAVEEVWIPPCARKGNCAQLRERRERAAEAKERRRRAAQRDERRDDRRSGGRDRRKGDRR